MKKPTAPKQPEYPRTPYWVHSGEEQIRDIIGPESDRWDLTDEERDEYYRQNDDEPHYKTVTLKDFESFSVRHGVPLTEIELYFDASRGHMILEAQKKHPPEEVKDLLEKHTLEMNSYNLAMEAYKGEQALYEIECAKYELHAAQLKLENKLAGKNR